MTASISTKELISRKIRATVANKGVRTFSAIQSARRNKQGGILGWLWNAANIFKGILGDIFNLLGITFSTLWGLFVSTAQYIWNFDWQITDKTIDQQIASSFAALGSPLGGLLGNAVGYLACGAAPGALIFVFNKPLGSHVLKNVLKEGGEEFLGNLTNLINATFQKTIESFILWGFKNVRKFIKSDVKLVQKLFGKKTADLVRAWGNEGNKPWSFAQAVDQKVEKIPNKFVKAFIEEFLEEAWDGCVEAGYVVANSVDAYLASQQLKQQQSELGNERYVEITPNRKVPDEKIILTGRQELLKPMIVQSLANHQLVENRDVGVMYAMSPEEVQEKRTVKRSHRPRIILHFRESKASKRVKKNRTPGVISFRLMNETETSLNTQKIQLIAQRIKSKFATPRYKWKKGKKLVSYNDWEKGYALQILTPNKNDARMLIEQILDIQGHSPEWEYMNNIANEAELQAYPDTRKKKTILGQQVETVQRRPSVTVEFEYALLYLSSLREPIPLVDTTGRYLDAVILDVNSA